MSNQLDLTRVTVEVLYSLRPPHNTANNPNPVNVTVVIHVHNIRVKHNPGFTFTGGKNIIYSQSHCGVIQVHHSKTNSLYSMTKPIIKNILFAIISE